MKKQFSIYYICILICLPAAAQEVDISPFHTFSIGGAGIFINDFTGGFMDAGFPIAEFTDAKTGKQTDLRNHVRIGGGADNSSNLQVMIRDRFVYGTYVPVNENYTFRNYFFADVGMLFFESEKANKTFWEPPFLFETTVGSGFEFLLFSNSAIFVETGLGLRFITAGKLSDYVDESFLFGCIVIGSRKFF